MFESHVVTSVDMTSFLRLMPRIASDVWYSILIAFFFKDIVQYCNTLLQYEYVKKTCILCTI